MKGLQMAGAMHCTFYLCVAAVAIFSLISKMYFPIPAVRPIISLKKGRKKKKRNPSRNSTWAPGNLKTLIVYCLNLLEGPSVLLVYSNEC